MSIAAALGAALLVLGATPSAVALSGFKSCPTATRYSFHSWTANGTFWECAPGASFCLGYEYGGAMTSGSRQGAIGGGAWSANSNISISSHSAFCRSFG